MFHTEKVRLLSGFYVAEINIMYHRANEKSR